MSLPRTIVMPELSILLLLSLSMELRPFQCNAVEANAASTLGIAILVPEVSASKCLKIGNVRFLGAPTQALDNDGDRTWADEVTASAKVIL